MCLKAKECQDFLNITTSRRGGLGWFLRAEKELTLLTLSICSTHFAEL